MIRHCILYEKGENAARACESICSFLGERVVTYDVCAFRVKLSKSDNFSLIDKQRPGGHRKRDSDDLERLFTENSAQRRKKLVTFNIIRDSVHQPEMMIV